MNAAFFDTNIFVYAANISSVEAGKQQIARQLIMSRRIISSTQVLMELYAVLTRKFGFQGDIAAAWLQTLMDETIVTVRPGDVMRSIETALRFRISHWDGLILTAAERADTQLLYSEDLSHGQTYGSVRVCNPFIEDFLK